MRLTKQDIGLILLYYLGFSFIRSKIKKIRNRSVARFIAFHDIMPEERIIFENSLKILKNKTNVISLDDFFAKKLSNDEINVVITFDDGYKGWVTYALPVLKKLELPATFFVSSGFIGLTKDEEAKFIKSKLFTKLPPRKITGSLTKEDLIKISDSNLTIGAHTVNHSDLELLKDRREVNYEIIEDKYQLEKIIGKEIRYFAYPTGTYNNTNINLAEVLISAGYKGAVTINHGFNTLSTNPYYLHRDLTRAGMNAQVLISRVFGNYDLIAFLKNISATKLNITKNQ